MKEKVFSAVIEELDSVLGFTRCEMENQNIPLYLQNKIYIAAEEIFVNISRYAFKDKSGQVTVKIDIKSEIILEFTDDGIPYNPLSKEEPDIKKAMEERKIGGLGIFLVKKLMDSAVYRYENGKNILTIRLKVA